MSKKSKSLAVYAKSFTLYVFYTAPERDRQFEKKIKAIVSECGGTSTAFRESCVADGDWDCRCKFLTRKQANNAAYLLTAVGCSNVGPYITLPKGKALLAVEKHVGAQEQKAHDECFEEFEREKCFSRVAKAVSKALKAADKDFKAAERNAANAAIDEFYEGPAIGLAIDEFYAGGAYDAFIEDFDYEAAYETAIDELLVK